ncbi:peptidoglycan-associated lipoprotein Pal [Geomonas sp. RF6]|uniref:peptidoglycan-associated lipoprotein Pal n=1 Tax=Geomonas sp. RF6 TaxID=2897342 RepID=UPI001E5D8673|nr:peptidoglycan-associated lipoprotein Pal [Geomonas sp. RF6]UFS70929.1 peptidoglycan-associated lipoprotein Pal [Geomonas sp. RF6]
MNATSKWLLPFLLVGTFTYAGCAKEEVVKKDEPLAPAAAVKPAPAAGVKAAPATVKAAPAAEPIAPLSGGELKESAAKKESAVSETSLQRNLETIYFGFDSSTLSAEASAALVKNVEIMKKNPERKVRVEGYCDERGSDEYNLALGERRAQGAAGYLATLGIPRERLSVLSYGNEKPADPGHDETAWAKNRRDEFVFAK